METQGSAAGDSVLDPSRLAALRGLELLDSPAEEEYDRLTRLAARLLRTPVALISLVDEQRQFFKSAVGLPEPWGSLRETPLAYSYCRYALGGSEPLVVEDAREHPLLQGNPSIEELGAVSYVGAPLVTSDGHVLGTFAVIDTVPRRWAPDEIASVVEFAGTTVTAVELRAAKLAMERSADALRALIVAAPVAIIALDLEGRVRLWNDGATRIFGWEERETLGEPLPTIADDQWSERVELLSRLQRGDTLVSWETTRRHKDGRTLPVEIWAAPLHDADGSVSGVMAVLADVSRRRRAEQELRESEERARAMIDSSFVAVLIHRDGVILDVNEAACRMFGYERDELLRFVLFDLIDEADHERVRAYMAAHGEEPYEIRGVHKDGTRVCVEVQGREAVLHEKPARIAFARDVTAQRRAEVERARLEERVRQTQKLESLGVLAGGIAHDFNNLLVGIIGNAALARSEANATARERLLDGIETAGRRAADLAHQMLAYAGRGNVSVEAVDLSALVSEMYSLLDASITKDAELVFELADNLPPVTADATQIRQVVMNLMTNAGDALADHHGTIRVRTALTRLDEDALAQMTLDHTSGPGTFVELVVSDTGTGMDSATRGRIFEPFYSTKFTGRGLGLASVLGIIRAHRGAIDVSSAPGEGTTFRIFLAPAAIVSHAPAQAPPPLVQGRGGRVLVVDDEPIVRDVAVAALEANGYLTLAAGSASQALEVVREGAPVACAVLDLTMPEVDGRELYSLLRDELPDLPVVFTSGYDENVVADLVAADPRVWFLAKPFAITQLLATVAAALGI